MFVPIPDALNKLRFQSQNLSILLLKAKYQLEEPEKLISEQLKHIDTPVIKAKKDILSKFENILYLVEEKKFELRHRVENEVRTLFYCIVEESSSSTVICIIFVIKISLLACTHVLRL